MNVRSSGPNRRVCARPCAATCAQGQTAYPTKSVENHRPYSRAGLQISTHASSATGCRKRWGTLS